MTQIKKCVSLIFLLALLTSTTVLFAQDAEPFTVVGSGIVNSVVESLAEANETDAINITTTGTLAGFEQFCNGSTDVVTATRSISADEDASCISNEIAYSEFLIAHSILTFIVHPDVSIECLTTDTFNTLFTPSATGQVTTWSFYDEALGDLPITFILPQENTVEYVILDNIVDGDGLRRDAQSYETSDEAVDAVSQTEGAIAVIPYSETLNDNDVIKIIDVNYNTATGCSSASPANVENRFYNAAQSLYLYANVASINENEALNDFMSFITTVESAPTINDTGFVAPTDEIYTQNAEILANRETGRLFTGTESNFTIPANLFGQIDIAGAANAYTLLDATASQFSNSNPQLVININTDGETNGIRRLCNGEIDIAVLQSELADDALTGCEANNINTVTIPIGTQAVVLVANAADTYATCLTTDQVNTIWEANATDSITNWSNVSEAFPDQEMKLFGLATLNANADILLSSVDGIIAPIRRDTERNNDPLYRAAAVANVEGALTFMSWVDYRRVEANNQDNIQLVSIDDGAGCVMPSAETITDGTYSLTRPATLLVSELSLTDMSVQSFLWQLFSDQGWLALDREGFIGISFGDLPAVRSNLETEFSLAEANIAASVNTDSQEETTEDVSSEATEEPSENSGD